MLEEREADQEWKDHKKRLSFNAALHDPSIFIPSRNSPGNSQANAHEVCFVSIATTACFNLSSKSLMSALAFRTCFRIR